jgi:hypothetical protein
MMQPHLDGQPLTLALSQLQLTDKTCNAESSCGKQAALLPPSNPFMLAYAHLQSMDKQWSPRDPQSSGTKGNSSLSDVSKPFSLAYATLELMGKQKNYNASAESPGTQTVPSTQLSSNPFTLAYAQLALMNNPAVAPSELQVTDNRHHSNSHSPPSTQADSPSLLSSPNHTDDEFCPDDSFSGEPGLQVLDGTEDNHGYLSETGVSFC